MNQIYQQLTALVSSKPLAVFRLFFGLLITWELLDYRFFRSEINDFFIQPTFHFSYPGMDWVPRLYGSGFELFYWVLIVLFVFLSAGFLYRLVSVLCFVGWSWLFFMERAIYFNHWYLVLLVLFLLMLLPANRLYSLDVLRQSSIRKDLIPFWCLGSLALLTGIVYFFSGTAKLNPDWLIGQPLTLVFQQELGHLPTGIQGLLGQPSIGLFASYLTVFLELFALPLLIWHRSRRAMIILLIGFNLLNLLFFPVGIFPLLMIALTLLWIPVGAVLDSPIESTHSSRPISSGLGIVLLVFFALQLLFPARRILYKGSQLWAEEGLLFSWPMFTTYKGGDALFLVKTNSQIGLDTIYPQQLDLTEGQYVRMVKNPDCLLQYAHHLGDLYTRQGNPSVAVYCDAYLHLNGRPVQPFLHPNIDLIKEPRRLIAPYPWVLPLKDKIQPIPNRQ